MNDENKIPLPGAMDPQPPKPDFLQGDEWFDVSVDDFLDFDKPYRPPRYTMERNGVPFADVGGEIHIVSKPGQRQDKGYGATDSGDTRRQVWQHR